jgi:hypothetical protein
LFAVDSSSLGVARDQSRKSGDLRQNVRYPHRPNQPTDVNITHLVPCWVMTGFSSMPSLEVRSMLVWPCWIRRPRWDSLTRRIEDGWPRVR